MFLKNSMQIFFYKRAPNKELTLICFLNRLEESSSTDIKEAHKIVFVIKVTHKL